MLTNRKDREDYMMLLTEQEADYHGCSQIGRSEKTT
jgi:hypothetical protein